MNFSVKIVLAILLSTISAADVCAAPKNGHTAQADCAEALARARTTEGKTPVPKACLIASSAPAAPIAKAESSACTKLASDYDIASKQLAMNHAEGVGDNSAPRATMREARNNNILEKARITVELMRGNSCKMPTEAPDMGRYLSPALKCSTDMIGASTTPASCDMTTWQPKS